MTIAFTIVKFGVVSASTAILLKNDGKTFIRDAVKIYGPIQVIIPAMAIVIGLSLYI